MRLFSRVTVPYLKNRVSCSVARVAVTGCTERADATFVEDIDVAGLRDRVV
ncbi:MAG: hypothetical protein GKS01_02385 [Alphaproteobacteria bacterium]|nr:hypothetical protein [Alphaproteobacteria bacterium]